MATDDRPPLEDRLGRLFTEILLDWLEEKRRLVLIAIVYLGVRIWQAGGALRQFLVKLWKRPERDFIIDLAIDTLVALVFSYFLRIFAREVAHSATEKSPVATVWGGILIDTLEVLHWTPLLVLFIYQTLRFCRDLIRRWRQEDQ